MFNEGGLVKNSEATEDEIGKSILEDRLELEVQHSLFKNRTEAADLGGVDEQEEDIEL